MYGIYIKKAHTMYGIDKVRQIYEEAIENLDVEGSKVMHLKFSELETKLGEIDRARAIYAHCSELCDPRVSLLSIRISNNYPLLETWWIFF